MSTLVPILERGAHKCGIRLQEDIFQLLGKENSKGKEVVVLPFTEYTETASRLQSLQDALIWNLAVDSNLGLMSKPKNSEKLCFPKGKKMRGDAKKLTTGI